MVIATGRRGFLLTFALSMFLLGTTSGYGAASNRVSHATPRRGGDLVFAHGIDIKTLDPIQAVETETIYPLDMIFETLFVTSKNGQGVDPWLARSYQLSKNKRTWTFHLRSGVKFSDGRIMTSADVKFSLDRNRKSKGGFSYLDSAIDRVSAPNPSTVIVHTRYPWTPLLADLALWANAITPKDLEGKSPAKFFAHPIGTGPFVVKQWSRGSKLVVVRNPHYWQHGKPYLNSVTWTVVPDDNTRLLQLKGGQAQIMTTPPFSTLRSLKSTPGVVAKLFPSTLETYALMNERLKQFHDVHVRRAIAYAIDRRAMVRAVLFGYGKPACSFMAPTISFNDQNIGCIQYNPTKAKREMAQSAYPKGFKTTLLVGGTDVYSESLAEIIQQELKPIGIDVTLQKIDPGQVYATMVKGDFAMVMEGWSSDIPDPDEQVSFMCDPVGGGADSYSTHYTNTSVIKWVHQAERAFNPVKRAALYRKIQVQVNHDQPWISLVFAPNQFAYSNSVHGFYVVPTGSYRLQDVWLSK